MSTFFLVSATIASVTGFVTIVMELKRDLIMMQQNSYRPDRYRRWLTQSADTTSTFRLVAVICVMFCLSRFGDNVLGQILMPLVGIWYICKYANKKYKKPLVWTARARRIYAVAFLLCMLVAACVVMIGLHKWLSILAVIFFFDYCLSHLFIQAAVYILSPYEKHLTRGYYNDAARILASMPSLKIVGITGSYGKTSTKYYLHRILSEHFETLMTPGSYNTTLGVVRTVREQLKPYHQIFIVEMGAKQPGDIREICDLVHPTTGILTAVGPQHLESFKTIERVRDTKFELIDSLPTDGLAIVNNDFAPIAERPVDNCRCLRYSVAGAEAQVKAVDITYSTSGTDFTVVEDDYEPLDLHTKLVGEFNISNLTAAVAAARALGVPDNKIRLAVAHIEPVEHRLSMKRTPAGVTILDDAFNSNPVGSRMALDVLRAMTGGKRIVVTPGMIELGDQQHELNSRFGSYIAGSADVAIIVGQYNRKAITEGIKEAKSKTPDLKVIEVDTFDQARHELSAILQAGDTVLYENDLPDTFK